MLGEPTRGTSEVDNLFDMRKKDGEPNLAKDGGAPLPYLVSALSLIHI